jgi:hypothetical protein
MRFGLVAFFLVTTLLINCNGSAADGGEGEGDVAAGEGEGDVAEGEGDVGEGEGDVGEGEGDVGEGEGEGDTGVRVAGSRASGTFNEPFTLDLTVENGAAPLTIYATTDDTAPRIDASLGTTTISISNSTIVRAIAVDDAGVTVDKYVGVFVKLAPGMTFSSNIPVLVMFSSFPIPVEKLDNYTPSTVVVFEPGTGTVSFPADASDVKRAGIKIRGSSSAYYSKSPWRVETWDVVDDDDDAMALLGMPSESDWVLNAPADFDRALMRNSLVFALSNDIGRYAPRTRYAEVFTVGDGAPLDDTHYAGVYEVTERVKRDVNRVNVTPLRDVDNDAVAITGGYIFKEDRTGPGEAGFYAGSGDGSLRFEQPFVLDDPEENDSSPQQRAYLASYLDDVGLALTTPGGDFESLIDVPSFIDHHILNVLAKNPDCFRLSGFLHKDRGGLLQAGPIWDFDRTMGGNDFRVDDPTWWDATNFTPDTTAVFTHGFYGGLFRQPTFTQAYWSRLADLLDDELSIDSINARIDANAQMLQQAAARNFVRYPEFAPRDESFNAEVAFLKDWLARRHAWMTACLALPDPSACTGN